MGVTLSGRLSERFCLRITPDLADWIDRGVWRTFSDAYYAEPDDPATLLEPAEAGIWSGMLLPDCLPLLGDGCGQRLCLRVGADNSVSEIVSWDHETGEWYTYGRTLAEALLYDACEALGFDREIEDWGAFARFADWALAWLPLGVQSLAELLRRCEAEGIALEQALVRAGIAEVGLRQRRCEELVRGDPVGWPETPSGDGSPAPKGGARPANPWPFPADLFSGRDARQRESRFARQAQELTRRDWPAAAREAARVCRLRGDLGWAHNVLGWEAEWRGDGPGAIAHYAAGLGALGTSDDFTEDWNSQHFGCATGRLGATRLWALRRYLPPVLLADPYLSALVAGATDRRVYYSASRSYWVEQGRLAEAQARPLDAYRCYYFAGWDRAPGDGDDLLELLASTARAAGALALEAVAELHLAVTVASEERRARVPHARLDVDTAPPRPGGIGTGAAPEERPAKKRWWRRR